jgi:hypothetical protein
MVTITYVYLQFGDWEGLYLDDKLVYEDETLSAYEIINNVLPKSTKGYLPIIVKPLALKEMKDDDYQYPLSLKELREKYKEAGSFR